MTAVEGPSPPGEPHPVAQAILDTQAAQCGYCISGIMVGAAGACELPPATYPAAAG